MRYSLAALAANICVALAASRTSAPTGALVVKKDPSSGQYSSIQDAVDALSTTSTEAQSIFIESGTYDEQVYIASRQAALTIYGYTENTDSYADNVVTITQSLGLDEASDDDDTATLRAWSSKFKMYNINLVNSHGEGSQALAVSASASEQGYYACQFIGYQDTILAETGYQLYAKSLIVGATDFIFGQAASAWFDDCDIRVLATSYGTITASGRDSSSSSSWYVINNSDIAAYTDNDVPSGAYYLGRPWEQYARVTFQSTSMTDVIDSAGWHVWSTSESRTEDVVFEEYDSSGEGSEGTRASFSSKISSPISIEEILGDDYASQTYVDTSYLS